ncbi:ankyrin repeat-containing protein [Brachyspira hyodysenteriae]|nr:ankyrin repeat-containing protein [Brachyspira hyodysenteriae]
MENFNYKILIFSLVLFLIFCLNAFSKSNIAIIDAAGRGDINQVK